MALVPRLCPELRGLRAIGPAAFTAAGAAFLAELSNCCSQHEIAGLTSPEDYPAAPLLVPGAPSAQPPPRPVLLRVHAAGCRVPWALQSELSRLISSPASSTKGFSVAAEVLLLALSRPSADLGCVSWGCRGAPCARPCPERGTALAWGCAWPPASFLPFWAICRILLFLAPSQPLADITEPPASSAQTVPCGTGTGIPLAFLRI